MVSIVLDSHFHLFFRKQRTPLLPELRVEQQYYTTEFLSPQQQTFLGFTGLFIIPPAFLMCVLNISALIGRNFLPKSSLLTKKKLSLIDMFVFLKSLK